MSHQTFVMAMVCASPGYLAPAEDALLLDVIDVAVIGNAPRAAVSGKGQWAFRGGSTAIV
ncbi:hypothetical protein E0H38_11635 [Rhizobium leguminosarum bv. viciae]|nr:hypothetical protein E0H33_25300 [Rhizobium leguminosarum bv. viciae]TBZ20217.1 hypothetical protein E0H38_11635 [Rhizobium leguminosarum bv. viciae]